MDRDLSWLINHDHSTTLVYQAPTAMSCSMKDRVEEKVQWPRGVRRELAIIRFCATVARNGFINDVVE